MPSKLRSILSGCFHRIGMLFHGKKEEELPKLLVENRTFFPQAFAIMREVPDKHLEIIAKGWSMRPFIEHDRDKLIFAFAEPKSIKVRDVVLAEVYPGKYICHRVERIDGQNITLRGDGNINGTEECTLSDIRCKLIKVERKGTVWNLETSRFWHIYSIVWPALLPCRRWLLALNKIILLHQFPERLKLWKNIRRHRYSK